MTHASPSSSAEGPTESAPTDFRHTIERTSLRPHATRLYTGLGLVLAVGVAAAVTLSWTGTWSRMLTMGDRGTLTVEDLLGLTLVLFYLIGGVLLVVLFTLKGTLKQVESDLQVADRRVDRGMRAVDAKLDRQVARAQAAMERERAALKGARESVLATLRQESTEGLGALRQELATDLTALGQRVQREEADLARERQGLQGLRREMLAYAHTIEAAVDQRLQQIEARAEAGDKRVVQAVKERLASVHPGMSVQVRELADRVESLRASVAQVTPSGDVKAMAKQLATLQFELENWRESSDRAHEEAIRDLRADAVRDRAQMIATLEDRVDRYVKTGVRESMRVALDNAFARARFYRWLGAGLLGGMLFVVVLAFAGIVGPGWFSARTSLAAAGLAIAVLTTATVVLILSFSDAVRLLRRHFQ